MKKQDYDLMFTLISEALKRETLHLPFNHPYDIDSRYESYLGLEMMPFDKPFSERNYYN